MRKVLALVLALCFFAIPAMAEEIDLTAMSLDELQALSLRLMSEIESRFPFDSAPFGSGVFIGGKSIKTGTYTFTCNEVFAGTQHIQFFASEEDFENYLVSELLYAHEGQSFTLCFNEGSVIVITNLSGVISPVKAPWAP